MVDDVPQVTIDGPDSATINQTLKFVCKSAKSNPFSTLQWVVDSKAIPASYKITEDSGSFSTESEISLNITDYDRFKIVSCYAHNLALGMIYYSHFSDYYNEMLT